jgi:RNA polymerase sigma factor (TIGR02999 family)
MTDSRDTTNQILRLRDGDDGAAEELLPRIYAELREIAARHLLRERRDHTLQATALAHEAWLKLVQQDRVDWKGRAHFLGVAAQAIRRILVDHARKRAADKRGGDRGRVTLSDTLAGPGGEEDLDLLALDAALDELAERNPRHHRAIELRFFGGLDVKEAAHVLGVSPQTLALDWRMARAWLRRRIKA